MTWIWLSVVIVLLGAELDAAIGQRKAGETADRLLHRHGLRRSAARSR
jgi:uncharacterized BrkB/YihY/UPF0761 family membrane protein